jgi:ADP-ribose pyrophosphatase YjhB (NUDIX family)
MRREYPSRPIASALALAHRNGKFLLVQRGKAPNKGRWGFPGGVQEMGETIFDAAQRELREETGVTASHPLLLDAIDAIHADEQGRVRYHYLLVAVLLEWESGEGVAASDAASVRWAGPSDLEDFAVLPEVARLMSSALERLA